MVIPCWGTFVFWGTRSNSSQSRSAPPHGPVHNMIGKGDEMVSTFERASTGLPGLDKVLDQLRLGDNVVWQVDSIDDYRHFVEPFVNQALAENRRVIYMRFGQHPEIIKPHPGVSVYRLDARSGFEAFSAEVHAIASTEGEGVYYVFDCLSDLLSAWATDLMIGNFFKVACPYLFELNTIAYFTVLRGRNSYQTIARIRDTTQLLLEVYHHGQEFYVHPLKVWNRYSPTMFLPHVRIGKDFVPITSSFQAANLLTRFQSWVPGDSGRKLDYWDRVFLKAQELVDGIEQGDPDAAEQEKEMVEQLCKMMIGRDERVLALARQYFSLKDLLHIRNRLIGSGFIGGKAVGMLLARNMLRDDPDYNWVEWLEPHDSFYVGSDVYYTYLVENDCWKLRMEQKEEDHYFSAAAKLRARILNGTLPDTIREQFHQMLEYFGQSPIIVRSSSLLEDSFGNAFAGKYESVFCVNQGTPQERFVLFEEAVKKVYASTVSEDALAYRQQRGLARSDEQMALLVQRVSGSHHGNYFFPDLAGVAMSRNPYTWSKKMDPRAGVLRLVLGLGTRAVNRVENDYPRIVALDKPSLRPDWGGGNSQASGQRWVDVLDTVMNDLDTVPLEDIPRLQPPVQGWHLLAVKDYEAIEERRRSGRHNQSEPWILTFDRLLGNSPFPSVMRRMLHTLETYYRYPVDIEFTVNFSADGGIQVNLLQCRPLQTGKKSDKDGEGIKPVPEHILFATRGNFMGGTLLSLKRIIYVQPDAYGTLPLSDRYQVARLVGELNRLPGDRASMPTMLIGPGRWGTCSPSLGVPVTFAEICNIAVLVEVAVQKDGYMPELSFGTHFFQDLVETQIFYVALFPGNEGVVFNRELLELAPNSLAKLLPSHDKWDPVIKVIDLADLRQTLWLDADLVSNNLVCYLSSVS